MRLLIIGLVVIQALLASDQIEVEGKLSVKGHDPFTFLAVTEQGGKSYKIVGRHYKTLYGHQGEVVWVKGKLIKPEKSPAIPAVLEVVTFKFPGVTHSNELKLFPASGKLSD